MSLLIKCPFCVAEKQKSELRAICGQPLTVSYGTFYYDEDGREHDHSPLITVTTWKCSRGHIFDERTFRSCDACGWKPEGSDLPSTAPHREGSLDS